MVAAGEFATFAAALDAAVSALQFELKLRIAAEQGIADLDAGRYLEFDEDGLRNYFRSLTEANPTDDAKS